MANILISHIAVSAHTAVVKKFGGVAAVFVGTARKGMTLILSFLIFPKESNWKYAVGALLVLGGLTVASLEKRRDKRSKDRVSDGNRNISIGSLPIPPHINGDGDNRTSEMQLLVNLDVELGSSLSAVKGL